MATFRLVLALALFVAAPSNSVAVLKQPACEECILDFVSGEDAGAYKDIKVPRCDGPCDCSAADSACFDPKVGASMKTGSLQHQAACCALCTATADCAGWVIASGVNAGTSQDDKPFCWLKHELAPIDKAANRAHGKCVRSYSCSFNWGITFLVWMGLCCAVYFGGGSVFAARTSGGALNLRAHPHYSHWIDLVGLVSDGVAWSRAAVQGQSALTTGPQRGVGGGRYTHVREHSSDDNTGGQKRRAADKSKNKRNHKKGDKKQKSCKGDAVDSASGSMSEGASEAAESLQSAVATGVAGTAAGGGGRW